MENDKERRPYYADPTANTAIGNVMREERAEKRKKEAELRKALIADLSSLIKEAKRMDCKKVNFTAIPVENLELVVTALRSYGR